MNELERKFRVGVGFIVKNEERDLPRALASVLACPEIQYVHIVDTGSTDKTLLIATKILESWGGEWTYERFTEASHYENGHWLLDDFSKARNHFVEAIDKNCDWCLWMDADDELIEPYLIRHAINRPFDLHPFTIVSHETRFIHHRLWRTGLGIKFKGACHEYPVWPASTKISADPVSAIIHYQGEAANQEPSESRNLRILKREYESGNHEPRTLFYLANSYRDAKDFQNAVRVYDQYLHRPSNHDEMIRAMMYKARCLRFLRRYPEAVTLGFNTLAQDQRFSEVWMELAYSFYDCKDYQSAVSMCLGAIRKKPVSHLFIEEDKYWSEPRRLTDLANKELLAAPIQAPLS